MECLVQVALDLVEVQHEGLGAWQYKVPLMGGNPIPRVDAAMPASQPTAGQVMR